MKTFEDMKHNIPDGATHYRDECKDFAFVWVKNVGDNSYVWDCDRWCEAVIFNRDLEITPIPQTNIETPEEKEAFDSMQSVVGKEVEWVNGDECRYSQDINHEYIYIGEHPHGDGHYVFSEEKGITYIANGYLLEAETPQQREERERLEAAYDLYFTLNKGRNCVGFDRFKINCNNWLRVVDKTNYRKEG